MKVRDIIERLEREFGRQPEKLMFQLIDEALMDLASKKQHYTKVTKEDLIADKRWYEIDDQVIDIFRVEIKDNADRYVVIPKLLDPHKLLKEDEY